MHLPASNNQVDYYPAITIPVPLSIRNSGQIVSHCIFHQATGEDHHRHQT